MLRPVLYEGAQATTRMRNTQEALRRYKHIMTVAVLIGPHPKGA